MNCCGNCKFFRKDRKHDGSLSDLSVCQRFPEYICRLKEDWCGEWQESYEDQQKRTTH